MDQNRLALRCMQCGEEVTLARLQHDAACWAPGRVTRDAMVAYLDIHSRHEPEGRLLHVELVAENATDLRIL